MLGWIKGNTINSKTQGKLIKTNLKLNNWNIIEFILSQNSQLTIFQIQDLLELDSNARFNSPGTLSNKNWTWRHTKNQVNDEKTYVDIQYLNDIERSKIIQELFIGTEAVNA